MKWEHKVDIEWMKSRCYFLCASDIKKLVPFTASGRPKKITDMDRIRVLSNKLKYIMDDDCVSTGAAARGHMLEPFAIEDFNEYLIENDIDMRFHHWDDVTIVSRKMPDYRGVSFSPDGMSVDQDRYSDKKAIMFNDIPKDTKIVEVKSYSTEKHIVCGLTDKMELEERWQIAMAMYVCPQQINEAYLIFYDPSCYEKMFVKRYLRSDLRDEIKTICQIYDDWVDFIDRSNLCNIGSHNWDDKSDVVISGNMADMYDIEKRLEKVSRFNP